MTESGARPIPWHSSSWLIIPSAADASVTGTTTGSSTRLPRNSK
ncbi:hypothetical protein ACFPM0_27995 [Pseudonocardia sulfidoxydans]